MLNQLFGGGESPRPSTSQATSQDGGKRRSRRAGRKSRSTRSRRSSRRTRGGSQALSTAAVPLTLLGLQKFFQGTKGRADLKAADRGVRKTLRRGRRTLRRVL
jgi:hypothetical protein